jgi:hypothetical protein
MQPEVSWPPLVPVPSQTIQFTTIHLTSSRHALILSYYLSLLLPSSVCPSCVPSNPVYSSPLSQSCRVSHPLHFSWFNYPNHICWGVKLRRYSLGDIHQSPFPCFFLGWNIFVGTLFSETLSLRPFPYTKDQVSYTYLSRWKWKFSAFYSLCSYASNGKTKILDRMAISFSRI